MKKLLLLLVPLLLVGTGCGNTTVEVIENENVNTNLLELGLPESSGGQKDSPNSTTKPTDPQAKIEPSNNLGGLTSHSLHLATSADHTNWELDEEPLVEAASVPDLIVLDYDIGHWQAGTLVSYFVDASDFGRTGEEKTGIIYSTDNGATWSEVENATITGAEGHNPVDPSIVQLSDGRLRLFYYDFPAKPKRDQTSYFYSAISTDGYNFTFEGEALAEEGITDPDVIQFNDKWYMFYAKPQGQGMVYFATSEDGLSFQAGGTIPLSGIPGSLVVGDELRVYGCGPGGIGFIGTTDLEDWSSETALFQGSPGQITCDPAPVQAKNGTFLALIKQAAVGNPPAGGQLAPSLPVN